MRRGMTAGLGARPGVVLLGAVVALTRPRCDG
jgi:hypothetical protein